MISDRKAIQYNEGQRILFEDSYKAIPFNIIVASLLAISLTYNAVPSKMVLSWLSLIAIVSFTRMIHCKIVVNRELFNGAAKRHLKIFLLLTLLMGLSWTAIYFASIPYADRFQLYLILLVCGGMAAGSTASLGIYLPSFITYILAIFLPVIIYNYCLWDVNKAIFATMIVLFLLAITIIAKAQQRLFKNIFFLTEQNKNLMEKFELLSLTDPLTGLYNRRHFSKVMQEEYNRTKRNQQSFSLLFIDVDNFKLINDNLGHPFGDKFLVYVANYLKLYLKRTNDIIFRLGGDEFAVLLLNTTQAETKLICDKIGAEFLKELGLEQKQLDEETQKILAQVSLSVGVVYVPYDSKAEVEQIIDKVDHELYQAKNEGKHKIRYISI